MAGAFNLLILAICLSLAALWFNEPIVSGLVAAALAAGVATIAVAIPPGEAGHLQRIFRPAAAMLAVPAAWMLIQILPLEFLGLAHPIWASAGEALGRPIGGGISVDPGATLLALGRYLSAAAVAVLAAAVTIDRQRAKRLLMALTAATSLIAIVELVYAIGKGVFLRRLAHLNTGDAVLAGTALGAILAAAMVIQQFELDVSGGAKRRPASAKNIVGRVASLVALATCTGALILSARNDAIFAAAFGLVTLGAVGALRRFGMGPWGYSAIVATALVVAVAIVAIRFDLRHADSMLAFAANSPGPLTGIASHVMADAGWAGTGAGTFAALVPIYRDLDDAIVDAVAPTASAAIAVEMGRPMLVLILVGMLAGITVLIRGALQRGRDAGYPAAGAACLIALVLLSFSQAGVFNAAVATITAATLGLALAQSRSRTARQ